MTKESIAIHQQEGKLQKSVYLLKSLGPSLTQNSNDEDLSSSKRTMYAYWNARSDADAFARTTVRLGTTLSAITFSEVLRPCSPPRTQNARGAVKRWASESYRTTSDMQSRQQNYSDRTKTDRSNTG